MKYQGIEVKVVTFYKDNIPWNTVKARSRFR